MSNIIVIAFLIIPWLIVPINGIPDPTRLIKAAFFDITMMGIIVISIIQGLSYEFKNKYLGYLSLWVLFTIVCNWHYYIVRGMGYNAGTIDASIHFILALVATMCACSKLDRIDFIRIAKAISISCTLISIFGLFQFIGLDPMKNISGYVSKESRHVAALLDHPDLFGNYIALGLPIMLFFTRPKYLICFGIAVFALLCAKSSLSIIAGFFGIVAYMLLKFQKSKKIIIATVLSVLAMLMFCVLNPSFNKLQGGFTGRTSAWQTMLTRSNNPLFGQGLGSVKTLNVVFGDNYWVFAHNDYLEIFISLGALGLFLFLLFIIDAFKRFNYKEENQIGYAYFGSMVAFLIIMFGSFPMEFPPLALFGLIIYWAFQRT